jgi:HTH-type transcriptional regulator, competence development regulator
MSKKSTTFGDTIREKRLAKGYSLRKFAELIDVSPTYLSLVEQSKVERPPTVERVRRMAEVLGEKPDELISLAGRVPEDLPGIIQSEPEEMPQLLRAAKGLTADQLKALSAQAKKMQKEDR